MKRIAATILLFISFYLINTAPVAQAAPSPSFQDTVNAIGSLDLSVFQFAKENSHGLIVSWGCFFGGCSTSTGELVVDGALQSSTRLVAQMIHSPPVNSGEYIADVAGNLGIIKPVYAQGIGYSALSPILKVWKAFRNLAYALFIIMFVIVGFMIMFRAQINPQTVVTIQAALPKMVVTLILITFSYAIAGFVVDLIYLILFLTTALFEQFGVINISKEDARNIIFNQSIITVGFKSFLSSNTSDASQAINNIVQGILPATRILSIITTPLAYLIIAVAMVIAMFRTLFALIMAWISIILSVIFAPMQLLLNALPQMDTFGDWLKNLVSNALIFPATGIMLLIGIALIDNGAGSLDGAGWMPPLISNQAYGATGIEAVRGVIGLGILMLLPEVGKLVKGAMGVKENEIFGAAGKNLQAGWEPVKTVGGVLNAPNKIIQSVGKSILQVGGSIVTQAGVSVATQAIGERMRKRGQTQTETDLEGQGGGGSGGTL